MLVLRRRSLLLAFLLSGCVSTPLAAVPTPTAEYPQYLRSSLVALAAIVARWQALFAAQQDAKWKSSWQAEVIVPLQTLHDQALHTQPPACFKEVHAAWLQTLVWYTAAVKAYDEGDNSTYQRAVLQGQLTHVATAQLLLGTEKTCPATSPANSPN